jgi:hypothetical protein
MLHDLLVVYGIGLLIGTIYTIIEYSNSKARFLELYAPMVIWPLVLLKEAIKFLIKK